MSIITPVELGQFLGRTLSVNEATQAAFAASRATDILSSLLCYNVEPIAVPSDITPSPLNLIGAGACGIILPGRFKVFNISAGGTRVMTEPFTVLRQVIFAKRGVNYAGTNTCSAPIRIVKAHEYTSTFNGRITSTTFNQITLCDGCSCTCSDDECTVAYVDADFLWAGSVVPETLRFMALDIASELLTMQQAGNLKRESIEGHSYEYEMTKSYREKYALELRSFSACNKSVL